MDIIIKKIIRSKRKTIALQVCDDATLIIKAPLFAGNDVINEIIRKHDKWLEKKKKEILSRNLNIVEKKFVNGERFLYLGKLYPLKVIQNNDIKYPLFFNNGCFCLNGNISNRRDVFVSWYKQAAKVKFMQRAEWYAEITGYRYNKMGISNAHRQWGSCTHLGNIYFSWRLIMSPLSIIDYIIVHELVHLDEKNHSRFFWDKVRLIMPDYKDKRKWLRNYGHLLKI